MESRVVKLVWICNFSNVAVRSKLHFSIGPVEKFLRKILHKNIELGSQSDIAQWISNGIEVIERRSDLKLYVISPHSFISSSLQKFDIGGVEYFFFRDLHGVMQRKLYGFFSSYRKYCDRKNGKRIISIVNSINPCVVNLIGAENPSYAFAGLYLDLKKNPLLVTMQTLMCDPSFKDNYPIKAKEYNYRANIEKMILKRARFISTGIYAYATYVWNNINSDAIIFEGTLAVGEKLHLNVSAKKYDFVFFARDISKGAIDALNAFFIARKEQPTITLNIVGGCSSEFRSILEREVKKSDYQDSVIISGLLPTHEDVLRQIALSKFALLPLRFDAVSGTIREAMSCGIPVLTSSTVGTPILNANRQSVLLSPVGDSEAMANNMCKLIHSPQLANTLRDNAIVTFQELYSNNEIGDRLIKIYKAIDNNVTFGVPIPKELARHISN